MTHALRPSLLIGLAFAFLPLAQGQSFQQWNEWGDAAMAAGDHYGASRFYAGALELEPGKMDLQWKAAEACRWSHQYDKAAALYARVVGKDHQKRYPDALFWYAEMLMCDGDHAEAERQWKKLLLRQQDDNAFQTIRARNALLGCELARQEPAPDAPVLEHLESPINTFDSEFGGRTDKEGTLFFNTLRGKVNKNEEVEDTTTYRVAIYKAQAGVEGWSAPGPALAEVQLEGDNANVAWSGDGRHLYFTRCAPGAGCRIMVSEIRDGKPTPPMDLEGIGDGHSTQPMVVEQNGIERMYFTSDREGGMGGMDIWTGVLKGAVIEKVVPLGPPVNTIGNEVSPFYDATGNVLYFSSDLLPGIGGYDIFTASHGPMGWSLPRNVGKPLNGPANDLYPYLDRERGIGFITSNRKGSLARKGATCCNDLYSFDLPGAGPTVVAATDTATTPLAVQRITSLREKLPVRLYFHNDEPEPRSRDTLTRQDYASTYRAYKALLPDYHAAHAQDPEGRQAVDDFFVNEVDDGFNDLNDFIALLGEALGEGQRIHLVVRGFASPLAKSDYNKNLSLRRIQSMINYLRIVQGGAFVPYLDGTAANGARLTLEKAPFGEDRSAKGVSDELEDLKGSVYSVGASRERRIESEQVLMGRSAGVLEADQATHDLGTMRAGTEQDVRFTVRNAGTDRLTLLGSEADCGCTTAVIGRTELMPGESTVIEVHFNGRAPQGPFSRTVHIRTNGVPETVDLTITGTIADP